MTAPLNLTGRSLSQLARATTRYVQFFADVAVLVGAVFLANFLRFDFNVAPELAWLALYQTPLIVGLQVLALRLTGAQRTHWGYVGLDDLKAFVQAAALSLAPVIALRLLAPAGLEMLRVPFSIAIMDTLLGFGGILGLRLAWHYVDEFDARKQKDKADLPEGIQRVLLVGAGAAGMLVTRELQADNESALRVVGFVDDDANKFGSIIQGIRVLGTTADLPRIVEDLKVDQAIISISRASRRDFQRILEICRSVPVPVKVIPAYHEVLQGNVQLSHVRDIQIEDLLGRSPITLDMDEIDAFLTGKTVLLTGAGGSIGSELARQVARHSPGRLLLVERSEPALSAIDRELGEIAPEIERIPLVLDVGDVEMMDPIFARYKPQVVLHAAAHKHVPIMECNVTEAIKNNVVATHRLGTLAGKHGCEAFVMMSSDKAVRPTSAMGASKRVAEMAVQSLNREFTTRYVAVRFGNVIGSTGSVIPIFRDQIQSGGPVTVTHPEMTRYFMTISEATQLVLQAGAMGLGGEIFILDMGEPIRILSLAKEVIKLSGLRPFKDIDIVFTGVRPGEKLFEELGFDDEKMSKTRHPKIFIGKIADQFPEVVRGAVARLEGLAHKGTDEEIRGVLAELLPESRLGKSGSPAVSTVGGRA